MLLRPPARPSRQATATGTQTIDHQVSHNILIDFLVYLTVDLLGLSVGPPVGYPQTKDVANHVPHDSLADTDTSFLVSVLPLEPHAEEDQHPRY